MVFLPRFTYCFWVGRLSQVWSFFLDRPTFGLDSPTALASIDLSFIFFPALTYRLACIVIPLLLLAPSLDGRLGSLGFDLFWSQSFLVSGGILRRCCLFYFCFHRFYFVTFGSCPFFLLSLISVQLHMAGGTRLFFKLWQISRLLSLSLGFSLRSRHFFQSKTKVRFRFSGFLSL